MLQTDAPLSNEARAAIQREAEMAPYRPARQRELDLPQVVREVGKDATVMIDTGIMNGADIVASVALGAKFTLIGRAYLYGLMAGGRRGVDRTIEILRTEIERTMQLLGVSSIAELEPRHVTQLQRLTPVAGVGAAASAPARRAAVSRAKA